jgi:HK97 family phage major capsid protein
MKLTKDGLKELINGLLKEALGSTLDEQRKLTDERQAKWMGDLMTQIAEGKQGTRTTLTTQERGILTAQFIRSIAAVAHLAKQGRPQSLGDFASKTYGKDAPVTKALSASTFTEGGVLVPEEVAADIIPLLRPASAIYSLNPVIQPMASGVFSMPKLTGGAAADYVGENKNAPLTNTAWGSVRLTAKKLAALVPMSNDWSRRAVSSGDSVVRDDLVAAVSQRGDLAFIRGTGSQYSPEGLRTRAQAANIIAANGTVNLANVTSDLGKLVLALANANVRMLRPGWLMSPRTWVYLSTVRDANGNFAFREEIAAGRLWGWPFKVTTQIPINLGGGTNESELYLADFADVVIGETETLEITTSSEAAYHDGSNVVAAFSMDQTVIRAIVEHDIGLRQDACVAVLTGVTWTP